MTQRFVLHHSPLNKEGCPTDPTSPVPPPFETNYGSGVAPSQAPSGIPLASRPEYGQMISKYIKNPASSYFEEVFRTEPNESWFSNQRNPSNPTQFEIGAIRPDQSSVYLLTDYSVTPYGFSGTTALDYRPLADDEISSCFGYSIEINGQAPGIFRYRLDPVPPSLSNLSTRFNQSRLDPSNFQQDDYVRSRANSFASAAGYGTAIHPQVSKRFGGMTIPWGEFVHEEQVLKVVGIIYRPIDVPLAFIQVRFSGFKLSTEQARKIELALQEAMR
jgi:hypothetical protein